MSQEAAQLKMAFKNLTEGFIKSVLHLFITRQK